MRFFLLLLFLLTPLPAFADFISDKVDEFDAKPPVAITRKMKPIIIIDAGHGGKDPGTIGVFARTKEKNLTLAYAKELGKQLGNTGRYQVFLTRDKDVFIPLKARVERARRKKADLFISLHVNSAESQNASGVSVYTLSETSSDKQTELLAQKENRADIINGVNFSGASRDILKTLIDMAQRESKNSSSRFANITIQTLRNSGTEILQNSHRFAGFAVLTAPDMASILIELGYLSNREEEKLLNSLSYKRRVVAGLAKAVDRYFLKK
ncbi:MAG: N-acetylmuramoyl-L-alanine amidase [Alphaproteobacteria bacterium]|nr:N-acetylmuramoyl-L-alanine amidase [Alphaproteobacteria bacterium]